MFFFVFFFDMTDSPGNLSTGGIVGTVKCTPLLGLINVEKKTHYNGSLAMYNLLVLIGFSYIVYLLWQTK